jgi:hypothetical protein
VLAFVNAGHLGYKDGEWFYTFSEEQRAEILSERDQQFLQLLKLFDGRAESDE